MKKTLMVLGFALCATIAFAQTSKVATSNMAAKAKTVANIEATTANAGYNASIFAKDGDTMAAFYFAADDQGYTTGTFSSTNPAPAGVRGRTNHGQDGYFSTWHRIPNLAYMNSAAFTTNYPSFDQYFMKRYVTAVMTDTMGWGAFDDNGFMLMSCYDQRQIVVSKAFNAYFELDEIDASAAAVVDVRFLQFYMKFYDTCYIDYTDATGAWHSLEININGVDCNINEFDARGMQLYTLPLAAAGNQHLKIRFRWYSKARSNRQATYGYVWAIDNITIHAGAASRLYRYVDHYMEGAYGQMPKGMQLPLSWYAPVKNNGSVAQTGITLKTESFEEDTTFLATSATGAHANMPADPGLLDTFFIEGRDNVAAHRGWHGYSDFYMATSDQMTQAGLSYSNNGIYTTEPGIYLATSTLATADENINGAYDTILYRVNDADNEGVYVWGMDNGLLLAGQNFTAGYVMEDGNLYTTDVNGGYTKAGYGVSNRFTTGAVIPTDGNGKKWVIRGVEIVPAALPQSRQYTGARISATLSADVFASNHSSVYFYESDIPLTTGDTIYLSTGAGIHTVTAGELNTDYGFHRPGDYEVIRIMFPEQPELYPNMSYRVGYQLEAEHAFSVAAMGTSYAETYVNDSTPSWVRLRTDTAHNLMAYARQFNSNDYSVYLNDPTSADEPGRFAWGDGGTPLIRMLVGPRVPVARKNITFLCANYDVDGEMVLNGGGRFRFNGQDTVCGEVSRAVGSSFSIDMVPFNNINAYKVDSVWIDGNYVAPYDPIADEGDPSLIIDYDKRIIDSINNEPVYNYHEIFTYTFSNLQADHTIKAKYKYVPGGIDPVRPEAQIRIYPNPANSSASVSIEGVTGKVNFSLLDMSGRVVMNKTVDAESVQKLNLTNLAKGAYFVRITNDEFSKVEKLIVR